MYIEYKLVICVHVKAKKLSRIIRCSLKCTRKYLELYVMAIVGIIADSKN